MAIKVPVGIALEMFTEVDGVCVKWYLDVNDVCGDEFFAFCGDKTGTLCDDNGLNCGIIEVV